MNIHLSHNLSCFQCKTPIAKQLILHKFETTLGAFCDIVGKHSIFMQAIFKMHQTKISLKVTNKN